ncbi:MAG: 4Fe-4S binding protein [Planctomycetota bacterium]
MAFMLRMPLPLFDHQSCKTTGWCVDTCPTDCLDLWNDRPYLNLPQACISCGLCEQVCPTSAVSLPAVPPLRSSSVEGK